MIGLEVMKYFLELDDRPTAIFAATDEMAIGAIHTILDAGLKVPEDISVISVDNTNGIDGAPATDGGRAADVDIGAVSMRLLTKLMNKEEVESAKVILPHELIRRKSTQSVS